MVDTHNAARWFDNVSVGSDAVLGQVDAGWTPSRHAELLAVPRSHRNWSA